MPGAVGETRGGICEVRKAHPELRAEVVKLAKEPRRASIDRIPKSGVLSIQAIAAVLAAADHVNERERAFKSKSVAAMLAV